jgi:hypothetical protein
VLSQGGEKASLYRFEIYFGDLTGFRADDRPAVAVTAIVIGNYGSDSVNAAEKNNGTDE